MERGVARMTRRSLHERWALTLAGALLAAGCGGGSPATENPTQTQAPTSTPAAIATTFRFDICALLPDGDVQAAANYPIPFDYSEGPTGDACNYYFSDQDHADAEIRVGAVAYSSAQEVRDGVMQTVNDYELDGWPTETVSGVGDEAWWLCQTEEFGECTLYVRRATYEISVQTTPSENPPLTNATRKGVAIAIATLVMGRLP